MFFRRTFLFLLAATQMVLVIAVPRSFARVAANITSCGGTGTVVINEFYPSPNSGEQEWVELYNPSDVALDISNWIIDDVPNGGNKPQSLGAAGVIEAFGWYVFTPNP